MKRITIGATQEHRDRHTVATDPAWSELKTATPAQIDAWLELNVASVADARRVLRILILATRHAIARGGSETMGP